MDSIKKEQICYNLLSNILIDNAYSTIEIDKVLREVESATDRAYITRLFYGVLEKSIQFDYIISMLTDKAPKRSVAILIKMGLYKLRYMDMPDYAAVDTTIEVAKAVGKKALAGFINAILHSSINKDIPKRGEIEDVDYLSAKHSYPKWIIARLTDRYGYDFVDDMFSAKINKSMHIRYNSLLTDKENFERLLDLAGENYEQSRLGYYVTHNSVANIVKRMFTVQSLASMIAVNVFASGLKPNAKVLDLCGAPGGKSIYLNELLPSAKVYCCDVHLHRVQLIRKYAERMRSSVIAVQNDANEIRLEWNEEFDEVICDVPCSGLGVMSKPDIFLRRKPDDINSLNRIQRSILDNAAMYVKSGGVLCYSTCTLLREENEDIVEEFLSKHKDFSLVMTRLPYLIDNDGMINLYPHIDSCDAFFVAKMRKN